MNGWNHNLGTGRSPCIPHHDSTFRNEVAVIIVVFARRMGNSWNGMELALQPVASMEGSSTHPWGWLDTISVAR
jgi:hypothetical protein